jgi:hypothetical protein
MHYTDATSVKAKLLDDGIVDTLVSAGATNAFTLPFLINASQNANPVAQHQMLMAPESQVRSGLSAGGSGIRTCMGLFLSSGCFGLC